MLRRLQRHHKRPRGPASATATCYAGTYSYSASHAGSCSQHHGVGTFY
ncbi:MAG: DUF3761 domain-containing protein [Candidatus Dormibacteria bacterium]